MSVLTFSYLSSVIRQGFWREGNQGGRNIVRETVKRANKHQTRCLESIFAIKLGYRGV